MKCPKLTISIVTYNGAKYLPECLERLKRQTFQDFELFVIDNNSTDESIVIIKKKFPEAKIIAKQSNLGFSKAHNIAIRESLSQYILVLNQDVFLDENYCSDCIQFLDKNSEVGSVNGKILRCRWINNELTKWEKTNIIDSCGLRIKKSQNVKNIGENESQDNYAKNLKMFGISGAAAMYRKAALEDIAINIGGAYEYFDEDFFMYKEDTDLAYRLAWRKWKSFCLVNTYAYHFRTKNDKFQRKSKQINICSYRNHLLLLYKNLSRGLIYAFIFDIFLYEVSKLVYIFFFEHSTMAGLSQAISCRKKFLQKRRQVMARRTATDNELKKWFI